MVITDTIVHYSGKEKKNQNISNQKSNISNHKVTKGKEQESTFYPSVCYSTYPAYVPNTKVPHPKLTLQFFGISFSQ